MTIRIQVLGRGLIPGGLGLAPRKEPFPATFNTTMSILNAGFKVNYLNKNGSLEPVTKKNVKAVFGMQPTKVVPAKVTKAVESAVPPQKPAEKIPYKPPMVSPKLPVTPVVKANEVKSPVTPAKPPMQTPVKETAEKPVIATSKETIPAKEVTANVAPAKDTAVKEEPKEETKKEEPKKQEEKKPENPNVIKPVHNDDKK